MRSFCVLYGPRLGMWVATPFSEMTAHIVILPPRWPGTSTMARWPCPGHVFGPWPGWSQLHPQTRGCEGSFPSNAIILYNRVKKEKSSNHQISHTEESYTRVTDNYIGMFYVLLHKFNILLATTPVVPLSYVIFFKIRIIMIIVSYSKLQFSVAVFRQNVEVR